MTTTKYEGLHECSTDRGRGRKEKGQVGRASRKGGGGRGAVPWATESRVGWCLRQVVGENIVLARALLEAVGVFATSVGARYAASGVLLRIVLLPVLERLGDPAAAVASSAAAAFGCICRSSGYRGLPDLVAANADYVVDSLCAQLRELNSHSRLVHTLPFPLPFYPFSRPPLLFGLEENCWAPRQGFLLDRVECEPCMNMHICLFTVLCQLLCPSRLLPLHMRAINRPIPVNLQVCLPLTAGGFWGLRHDVWEITRGNK